MGEGTRGEAGGGEEGMVKGEGLGLGLEREEERREWSKERD